MRKTQVGDQGTIELVVPPQSGGERSEPERSGGTTSSAAAARIPGSGGRVPDPEVAAKRSADTTRRSTNCGSCAKLTRAVLAESPRCCAVRGCTRRP